MSRDKSLNQYQFKALDESGKTVNGVESATSTGAAHVALLAKGLQPLEVSAKKSVLNFEITQKKVPRKDLTNFTRQLAVFMKAGIPIMEALEVITEETQNKMLKNVLGEMIDSLRSGDTFAAAAATHPEAFPNFYVGILESAELTGNLDIVLNQLADYIDRDQKARAKVTAALIYPSVVACMSVVVVVVLAVFVLPRFETFFKSLNAKLASGHKNAARRHIIDRPQLVLHCRIHHSRRGRFHRHAALGEGQGATRQVDPQGPGAR